MFLRVEFFMGFSLCIPTFLSPSHPAKPLLRACGDFATLRAPWLEG